MNPAQDAEASMRLGRPVRAQPMAVETPSGRRQLSWPPDPKVYEQMSRLLDDLIEQAQAAAFAHRCNLAFGRVDIQFEGVLPVSRDTFHNPLRGTITLDKNDHVIGAAHEAVAPPLQLTSNPARSQRPISLSRGLSAMVRPNGGSGRPLANQPSAATAHLCNAQTAAAA